MYAPPFNLCQAGMGLSGGFPQRFCRGQTGLTCFRNLVAAWSGSFLTLPGLIDFQGPTVKFLSIQGFDSGSGIGLVLHFDEAKAPESPGISISDQIDRIHRAVFFKQPFDRSFCGAEG